MHMQGVDQLVRMHMQGVDQLVRMHNTCAWREPGNEANMCAQDASCFHLYVQVMCTFGISMTAPNQWPVFTL